MYLKSLQFSLCKKKEKHLGTYLYCMSCHTDHTDRFPRWYAHLSHEFEAPYDY